MQTTIRVDGSEVVSTTNRLLLATDRLEPKIIRPAIAEGMEYARTYPPTIPGQTYVRTGRYFRSFRITQSGRAFTISSNAVHNNRKYSRYVGGYADGSGQASIHAGRWVLLRTAVQWAMSQIVRLADEAFNRAATGSFGL